MEHERLFAQQREVGVVCEQYEFTPVWAPSSAMFTLNWFVLVIQTSLLCYRNSSDDECLDVLMLTFALNQPVIFTQVRYTCNHGPRSIWS